MLCFCLLNSEQREFELNSKKVLGKPYPEAIEHAALVFRTEVREVKKRMESAAIRLDFICGGGHVQVLVKKTEDGFHQVVRLHVSDATGPSGVTSIHEATAKDGARLDVHPITLSELHRCLPQLGNALVRLLQESVMPDGMTNHVCMVRGRLRDIEASAEMREAS